MLCGYCDALAAGYHFDVDPCNDTVIDVAHRFDITKGLYILVL